MIPLLASHCLVPFSERKWSYRSVKISWTREGHPCKYSPLFVEFALSDLTSRSHKVSVHVGQKPQSSETVQDSMHNHMTAQRAARNSSVHHIPVTRANQNVIVRLSCHLPAI
uniref:Uncharacterized protein n=1 Tax=Lygus hesperus TaxID=30085 RepID=A0A146LN74_LYGHE